MILGIHMGVIAQSVLKAQNYNDLTAITSVNPRPPVSCTVDGVQVALGCALGKGTIRVSGSASRIAWEFHAGNRICAVMVRSKLLSWLDDLKNATEKEVLEVAESVLARPGDELFQITLVV